MYLTRIPLDTKKRETMALLASPERIHGAVEQMFDTSRDRPRNLWRLDTLNGQDYLMIVSPDVPDTAPFSALYGAPGQTKAYDPFLSKIESGMRFHFRLVANPTICKSRTGRVYAHITPEYQKQWLLARCEKHGFSLNEGEFQVLRVKWFSFEKSAAHQKVKLLGVSYDGTLTVTDASLFRTALTQGIGREKAYGMGMLTVAKAAP